MTMLEAVRKALEEGGIPGAAVAAVLFKHKDICEGLSQIQIPAGEEGKLIERLKVHNDTTKVSAFLDALRDQIPQRN